MKQSDCSRAKVFLLQQADDELAAEHAAWLERHLQSCASCRSEQSRFQALDRDLGAMSELMETQNSTGMDAQSPPGMDARTRLLALMADAGGKRSAIPAIVRWLPAMAAVLAASIVAAVVLSHGPSPARRPDAVMSAPPAPAERPSAAVHAIATPGRRNRRRPRAGQGAQPPYQSDEGVFVPIPYSVPLDPFEGARVIRMDIPVAALIAVGYRVPMADPNAIVKADVLVGMDGRARAVRVLSDLSLTGTGD